MKARAYQCGFLLSESRGGEPPACIQSHFPPVAPTIDSATGTPVVGNPTVADLKAEATVDPLYQGVPRFHWELVSQPEGGNAMIGNPNEKEAKLRVDKGGEYVVRLTVTDEDKTSSTEVTVTMTDAADGIQRVKTVITQVGVAPTMEQTLDDSRRPQWHRYFI